MLKKLIKDYKKQLIKASLGRTATSIVVVLFYTLAMVMMEYVIPSRNIKQIIMIGSLYILVNLLRTIVTLFENISKETFEKEIEADYREKIFIKLQNLKQEEMDNIRVGEILENVINDTKQFAKYYTDGIDRAYLGGILRLIGTLAVLMYLNIPIVTIAFLMYMIGFFITFLFNKKSVQYTRIKKRNKC